MPTYVCTICEKSFDQKGHFDSHKARKTSCKKKNTVEPVLKLTKPLTKPFLKWVGGKTQIIETVLSLFPKEFNNYYEPFLGGGSVLLAFLSYNTSFKGKVYASDINPNTIALYKHIQTNVDGFIIELKKLVDKYNSIEHKSVNRSPESLEEAATSQESYYYYMRHRYNTSDKLSIEGCAMLLFLNKTCFRGVYREGPHGFNVPFGHYKTPAIYEEDHLKEVSKLIQNVEFRCCSFEITLQTVEENDFTYLDPPYAPEKDTSFVGYVADGFTLNDHEKLFNLCKSMKAKFLMSNAEVELVKNSFAPPKFTTQTISCRRAINAKDPSARTNEVLINNY
jgi:DNA adenine methylase